MRVPDAPERTFAVPLRDGTVAHIRAYGARHARHEAQRMRLDVKPETAVIVVQAPVPGCRRSVCERRSAARSG